ncbi:MAG: DUF1588 domain-containing protein [Nitrospiraceae bacterium]|nr:DUF1588 domain-containing protein [Nitrospiraceae bacterium]
MQLDNATCSGCHALMNPIGFAFERFDSIGRERLRDKGMQIDDSGEITDSDVDGSFEGLAGACAPRRGPFHRRCGCRS